MLERRRGGESLESLDGGLCAGSFGLNEQKPRKSEVYKNGNGSGSPLSYERIVKTLTDFGFSVLVRGFAQFQSIIMQKTFAICLVVLIAVNCVTSRWLPTRSQDDRLDKLREMLKDLLESEIERPNYESKNIFKREVGTQLETVRAAEDGGNLSLKEKHR